MAKIVREIEIDFDEIMELIRGKYGNNIKEENFESTPYLEIDETGDYDRGDWSRVLKSITFYIRENK
jgi:hypothetical protein